MFDQFVDLFGGIVASRVDVGRFSIEWIGVSVVCGVGSSVVRHAALLVLDVVLA